MAGSKYIQMFLEQLSIWTARAIPVSILVLGSSLVWNLSIGNKIASLEEKKITIVEESIKKHVDEEIKKQLQEKTKQLMESEWDSILARKDALLKLDKESSLGRNYVSQEISKQEEDQAKKLVKEEMSQVKSDLIGQVAFPVVFAIASIFAAFAVKDILTEILKKEEKNQVVRDITKGLQKIIGLDPNNNNKDTLASKLDRQLNKQFDTRISELKSHTDSLQTYTYWLEYKLLSMEMAKVFDLASDSVERSETIALISRREQYVLKRISCSSGGKINLIKEAERKILEYKSNVPVLELEDNFISKIENWNDREMECFKIQMKLLLSTLKKLIKTGDASENEITSLINNIENFISKDFSESAKKGEDQSIKDINEANLEKPKFR